MTEKNKNVEKYFNTIPKNSLRKMNEIRRLVKKEVPEAEELISYRIPAFKFKDRIILYYSPWKEHIGLYPPPPKILRKECLRYSGPKGNLKFPLDKPLPIRLIRKIIKLKVKEIKDKE